MKWRWREKHTMNETLDIIFGRKSVRAFLDREISEQDKRTILEAAISAPSAGNQQLYTIIDVIDDDKKKQLAVSCDNQPFIAEGKLVLVFCADCKKWYDAYMDVGCGPRLPGTGDLMLAVSDAVIAAQTAVIAAESMGIGSCYIGDIMENCETQRTILSLPEYVFPCAMLVFGYPTQQQIDRQKPPRPDMELLVFTDEYPTLDASQRERILYGKERGQEYSKWLDAFCRRKYNSDFSVEMTRSVEKYLSQYKAKKEE